MKKIILLGHKRNGKDTVAEMINKHFGVKFESSSMTAAKLFIYDKLKEKYGYKTFEECYEDRMNHRPEWYQLITEYNTPNKTRLAEEIFKINDIYVGMRNSDELAKCKKDKLVDMVIGVYDYRKEEESEDSFPINLWEECDVIIPNSGTLEELEARVIKFFKMFYEYNEKRA